MVFGIGNNFFDITVDVQVAEILLAAQDLRFSETSREHFVRSSRGKERKILGQTLCNQIQSVAVLKLFFHRQNTGLKFAGTLATCLDEGNRAAPKEESG